MAESASIVHAPPQDRCGAWLYRVSRGFAFLGGATLLAMTVMSVASVVGRALFAKPVVGDFELVQIGCAIAVAACLPYCQMRRGHVIVDFFTAGASLRARGALDAFGALLLGACAALVAWRMLAGAASYRDSGETSMLLGIPTWWAYVPMIGSFALLSLTGLYTAIVHWRELPR